MTKKRLLAILISAALLVALIMTVDSRRVIEVLAETDPLWLGLGLLLFIPQILVIALRWSFITRPIMTIPLPEATRQVLAASSLNLFLPSKLGDLAKGVFLCGPNRTTFREGMHVVVFEKLMDLYALSLWMVLGWLLFPSLKWWVLGMLGVGLAVPLLVSYSYFRPFKLRHPIIPRRVSDVLAFGPRVMKIIDCYGPRRWGIFFFSMGIWLLHLVQIHCFLLAVGVQLNVIEVVARMPIALFAGLLPLTMAGFGTRDWAIVAIFASPSNSAETLVAAALLIALRYVVPAVGGIAYLPGYVAYGMKALTWKKQLEDQK